MYEVLLYSRERECQLHTEFELLQAWLAANYPIVKTKVVTGELADVVKGMTVDIVAPGNSFGFMDGGFDQALVDLLGKGLEREARRAVSSCGGEMPVGTAYLLRLVEPQRVIYAPTMRGPRVLHPYDDAVYQATRAALLAGYRSRSKRLLLPGMGTGVGGLSPMVMRWQMAEAFTQTFSLLQRPSDWREAKALDERIRGGLSCPAA